MPSSLSRDWRRWKQYEDPDKVRAARRFRHHIQTPSNPRGRVVRLPCVFCPLEEALNRFSEAHHPNHKIWWVVVWACERCHRMIEHGSLRVLKKHLFDYSSLLLIRPNGHRENRPSPQLEKAPF